MKYFAGFVLGLTSLFCSPFLSGIAAAEDCCCCLAADSAKHSFEAGKGAFLLDGQPFVVKAAELHYPRIPRPYWDHRIKMSKALGMNTICLYVFWNAHEPSPGKFDFTGQNDLREFIRLCAENDMKVILRPGPYVCAEWEMGGLPWWLLQKKDIRLREQDPYFMERVDLFQKAVAEQTADLTIADGGPIIMVQVENEYGSYGTDKPYVSEIRDMLRRNFGEDVTMFQCDWSSNFLNNGLDDLVWTLNFGTGADIDREFAPLKEARPDAPLMCSEYWSGWFDKWGAGHETRPADDMVAGIDEMLSKGISFSLYMTHGGTNWGHWAGANSPGFAPDVTSYDYDAPISESGAPTPKYFILRNTLAKYSDGKSLPEIPDTIPTIAIDKFTLTEVAPLMANLPSLRHDEQIRTMEEYGQGFGSILYATELPYSSEAGAVLTVDEAHDYAQVMLDGKYIGTLDRRLGEKTLTLPAFSKGARLEILVEAMGRINFGRAIKDFKGITDSVSLTNADGTQKLSGWDVYCLPDDEQFYNSMELYPTGAFTPAPGDRMPRGVYKGTFNVESPSDTFLNFETWGKGLVYVNGHPLGRIWEIGPQQTLYMPGCWLKEGENEITVFDILGPRDTTVEGLRTPIIDRLNLPVNKVNSEAVDLSDAKPFYEGDFTKATGWQSIQFAESVKGRQIAIEMTEAIDGGDTAAIAELYLIDAEGKRIPREGWKATYVDSEQLQGNHTADKAFDLQESTYWSTAPGAEFPHLLIIDLGGEQTLKGLEYLPPMTTTIPGALRHLRLYTL